MPLRDLHWLFVLTPPYSGSTAVAMLVLTAENAVKLQKRAEGQWLVPHLSDESRWDPEKVVDFPAVRETWESAMDALPHGEGSLVVVEKSPPNTVRADGFRAEFPNSTFVALNRNPLARAASELYREHPQVARHRDRSDTLRKIARRWSWISRYQERWIKEWSLPRFRYESICASPEAFAVEFGLTCPALTELNPNCELAVKEYPPSRFENHNPRQQALLSLEERRAVANALLEDREILQAWDYLEEVEQAAE